MLASTAASMQSTMSTRAQPASGCGRRSLAQQQAQPCGRPRACAHIRDLAYQGLEVCGPYIILAHVKPKPEQSID